MYAGFSDRSYDSDNDLFSSSSSERRVVPETDLESNDDVSERNPKDIDLEDGEDTTKSVENKENDPGKNADISSETARRGDHPKTPESYQTKSDHGIDQNESGIGSDQSRPDLNDDHSNIDHRSDHGTKSANVEHDSGMVDSGIEKAETTHGRKRKIEGPSLEEQYPPITSFKQRQEYSKIFDTIYPIYLAMYEKYRPHAVAVESIRKQLRTMPTAALADDNRRRELTSLLKRKYIELGYGNDEKLKQCEQYVSLVKKIRFLKERAKDFDDKIRDSSIFKKPRRI